jgi:hypothetical protein
MPVTRDGCAAAYARDQLRRRAKFRGNMQRVTSPRHNGPGLRLPGTDGPRRCDPSQWPGRRIAVPNLLLIGTFHRGTRHVHDTVDKEMHGLQNVFFRFLYFESGASA